MPIAKLNIVTGKSTEYKKSLMTAIEDGMASAFTKPASDVVVMLSEYPAGSISNKDNNFIYVEILAIAGRSDDSKRQLYKQLYERFSRLGPLNPTDVLIMLHDMPKQNCGVRGGQMAADIELGFKVNV